MKQTATRIGPSGRLMIPADFRSALGLNIGDEVILRLEDGAIALFPRALAVRRAQKLVRDHVPAGRSLSAELIATRRSEAES